MLKSAEETGLFNVQLTVTGQEEAEVLSTLSGDGLWNWLLASGYEETVRVVARNQLIPALVADFCHFVFEALRSSKKGKLTVAFTLLRKPLKENLFLLELLLSREYSFLQSFITGEVDAYASFKPEERIRIIQETILLLDDPRLFDGDYLHALRYDKQQDISLERLWQKSHHLITTFRGLETEEANLNFIFSDRSAIDEHWDYLYLVLPMLLYYSAEIIQSAFALINPLDPAYLAIQRWRRRLHFLLWGQRRKGNDLRIETFEPIMEIVRESVAATCNECGVAIELTWESLELAVRQFMIRCANCGAANSIEEFVEDLATQVCAGSK